MGERMAERESGWTRDRLPPPEVQRYSVEKEGLLETPLDGRGLADLDSLVKLAKQAVDPEFSWPSRENDVHHLQWMSRDYDTIEEETGIDGQVFRNLVNRKAYVPRIFHNWVHHITLPPPVPSAEVMYLSIEAQRVAMSLAKTAELATRLTRWSWLTEAQRNRRLDEEFINYNLYIENARGVPKEFSLLKIEQLEARTVDERLHANKRLGKLALNRIPIVQRQIYQAA
jgi:hypothetical protein